MHGDDGNVYRISVGKSEGKNPLGKPGHTWEDNIKTDLGKTRFACVERIPLTQDRN
jgi:hypothetical protein